MYALIIDDSRAVRAMLAKMMGELGYEIEHAGHGEEALARLEANPNVTLALVDRNMPVMDGLEFVRTVRCEERWNHVLLVIARVSTASTRW